MEENKNLKKKKILIVVLAMVTVFLVIWIAVYKPFESKKASNNVATKEKITPLMYEITKEGSDNKIYLFGSIHIINLDRIDFPEYVTNAYKDSKYLACEVDTVEYMKNSEVQQVQTEMYTYNDGTTLKEHLSEETYNKVKEFFKSYKNIQVDGYNAFGITNLIEQKAMIDATKSLSAEGIDTYFLEKAKEDGKTILEVESVEFQLKLISGFSDRLYELEIMKMIDEYDYYVESLQELYDAWKSGNVEKFEVLTSIEDDNTYSEYSVEDLELLNNYNYKLLDERNAGMADKLMEYFENNQKVFFMVGAAHLVGENGIASILEENGYTVKQVNK